MVNINRGIDGDLSACLTFNPQEVISEENIQKVIGVIEGQRDEASWYWVILTKDNKYVGLTGGCDYTGWDCVSWATSEEFDDPFSAVEWHNLPVELHTDLLAQILKGVKKETWREVTGRLLVDFTAHSEYSVLEIIRNALVDHPDVSVTSLDGQVWDASLVVAMKDDTEWYITAKEQES